MASRLHTMLTRGIVAAALSVSGSGHVMAGCPPGVDVITVEAVRNATVAAFRPDGTRLDKLDASRIGLPQKVCIKDSRGRLALDLTYGQQVMVSQMQLKVPGNTRTVPDCGRVPNNRPIKRIEAVVAGAGTQCVFR